jgi:selenide,water dikinase
MKTLVLVGGGHSHAIVLKLWERNPLKNVRLILISDVINTPYSGMLPGYIAGFYSYQETHINLPQLAQFAQADFYLTKAIDLDLENHQVICENGLKITFDVISIDIGSTPKTDFLGEFSSQVIPAKPVPQLLEAWENILNKVQNKPHNSLSLTIVGGGAGGVELALNMQAKLLTFLSPQQLTINLIHQDKKLLNHHNFWVSSLLTKVLLHRKINLYLSEKVIKINSENQIICQSGLTLNSHYIFWVTQASPATWIKTSDLTTDQKGFILVKNTLQSLNYPFVFAAGDIATMVNYHRPKAGVFAVRQGKPLFKNLQHYLLGKPLINYYPQPYYLALIGTGDRQAVASWGFLAYQSSLLWQWKDRIDRKFMENFTNF